MTLTTEQIETITLEVAMGQPPTMRSREALEFRDEVGLDIAKIRTNNRVVDIVSEWPDARHGDK